MCRTKYSAPQDLFLVLGSETLKEQNVAVGTKNEISRVHELLEQDQLLSICNLWLI